MNASYDEAFEGTVESLACTEETISNLKPEVHTTAIMPPKPKSATKYLQNVLHMLNENCQ